MKELSALKHTMDGAPFLTMGPRVLRVPLTIILGSIAMKHSGGEQLQCLPGQLLLTEQSGK